MAVVKVEFEATIKGKKKSVMTDSLRIHVVDPGKAKEIFLDWTNRSFAIRGDSGVFHSTHEGTCKYKKHTVVET